MATIFFNAGDFRTFFPNFADPAAYPTPTLQVYWDTATSYISNKNGGCYVLGLKLAQQKLALNLMTAHIAALFATANAGQATGLVQSSTIDKVSVTLTPPPVPNQWQWWLNQTPYGQQLLALLQVAAVGGGYFGGYPTSFTLRR